MDSKESKILEFYTYMPRGDILRLGQVLLNYLHVVVRQIRDLMYISAGGMSFLALGPTMLTERQINARKFC